MTLKWRDTGGALRTAGAVSIRTVFSTDPADLKIVDQIRLRVADGTSPADLKEVYKQGIRLAVTPPLASSNGLTTNYVTVSVAGGTPPYSYSWTATNGVVPSNPFSASTSFNGTPPAVGTCVVTDTNNVTNQISVNVRDRNIIGGTQ